MTASSTSRLLSLLSLLQIRRDWPGPVLAERLEISRRTVRRDVDQLREMGYSIQSTMGPDGGYRLDAGDQLPPLLFDDEQVIALAVALQAAMFTGVGIEDDAARALATLRQVMPSRLRHRLAALEFTAISSRPPDTPAASVSTEVLIKLSAAVHAHRVLRFDYRSRQPHLADEVPPPRRVEPHHLVTSSGRWYLVAWDLDRDDWRLFRADRISTRTPSGPRFAARAVPGGDVATYVLNRFTGSRDTNQWPCVGKVILHRPASSVVPFVGDAVVEDLGGHRCSLEAGGWSWVALATSLNRFDTDVDVLHPDELKEAFALLAERNSATAT
ncbi:MAG: WYL domain-containing protein [Ornithinimicrobium sp.]